jgi:hypothetical protein
MLKRFEKPFIIILFACWMAGFAYQTGRSSQHQEYMKQPIHRTHLETKSEQTPEITFLGIKPGEVMLVLVTFWLVFVTRDLVNEAKASSEKRLRAYISVRIEQSPDIDNDSFAELTILFKNSGQTPAYNVRYPTGYTSDLPNFDCPEPPATLVRERAIFDPGEERRVTLRFSEPLSAADKDAIQTGAKLIFVFGKITFTDAFGNNRWRTFCLMHGGQWRGRRMFWRPEGNDTSESEELEGLQRI